MIPARLSKGEIFMQIGAQMFTVREHTQNELDFAETIRKIAAIGYKGVQVSAIGLIPAGVVADICDSNGVSIVSTHTNPIRILNETEAVIADHKTMGTRFCGIGMMPGQYHNDGVDGILRFVEDYRMAAEKLAAEGIQLTYHNHDFEFEKRGGKLILDLLAEHSPMFFVLDTFWIQSGGGDPSWWIRKLAGRVEIIHFKDMGVVAGQRRFMEIMEGNILWPPIFEACKAAGVEWAFVEQDDTYGRDPFDSLRISFENINKSGYL